ncbi:MAG: hypothetical protein GY832_35515 [Chloroflexi bacterium]|nr:hypothetical protein [Chloroflexota bacterium]
MSEIQLTKAQKASWAAHFARSTLTLMRNENVLRQAADGQLICVAWPQAERVVLLINPYVVDQNKVLGSKFQHSLRTVMHGHRTVVTNSRGIFFQVGYLPEPLDAGSLPTRVALDLSGVPSGDLMVPLGVTRRGDKWISLLDADSVLIGGTRQMGKTTLLHAWILSLISAETPDSLRLLLCDGKNKAEFGRYASAPHVHAVAGRGVELGPIIGYLREELVARSALLREHGARNVKELAAQDRPPFLVLIVDELAEALTADGVEQALRDLVSLGGAYGVLPVLATQRPDSSVVAGFLKCNMATRISLPVPASQDSKVILGRTGAEKIEKRKGRIVLEWAGRMIEAQAYDVPTEMLNETLDRLAAGEALGDPPLALEVWQVRLVRAAVEGFGGAFNIRKLAEATGISRKWVERLAPRWEVQGLLEPAGSDAAGRRTPRRVTRRLRDLAQV